MTIDNDVPSPEFVKLKPKKVKETSITNRIIEALNKVAYVKLKKFHGSVYGHPELDIYGSVFGRPVFIEVKVPGKKPTPRQEQIIAEWNQAGAIAVWATSLEEAVVAIYKGLMDYNDVSCDSFFAACELALAKNALPYLREYALNRRQAPRTGAFSEKPC